MGAFLLAAGAPEKRFCLPNSRTMIHQPSGGAQGQATDVQIQAQEMIKTKTRLNKLLAKHTGKSIKKITDDTERDTFMDAEESRFTDWSMGCWTKDLRIANLFGSNDDL